MTAAGYVAVPETWKAAGRSVQTASEALAKAADRLCAELTAAGPAWGQDDLGRAFFNGGGGKQGFGQSRDQVLPQIGDMVNVLAGTGDAMVTSGANYARAEQASTIGGGLPGSGSGGAAAGGGDYRLPPFTGGMAATDPPPGVVMQFIHLVESLVAGAVWPDGSTGGLGQIRDALSAMGTAIGQVTEDVGRAMKEVTRHNAGSAAESFDAFASHVARALSQLQQACEGLSQSADNLRRQKDAARIQTVAGAVFVIGTMIAAQFLAPFTFGGSEAAALATAEAEAQALRVFLMMLARAVIEGLWYSGGMDAIGQLSRMITGLQKGFNVGELAKAGGEGALAGLVMGGLGAGARLGAGRSAVLDALTKAMDSEGAKGLGTRLAFNSVTGFAGNVASQAAFDDGNVDLKQAGQFAVGMGIIGEGMEKGLRRFTPAPAVATADTAGVDIPSAIDEAREPSGIQVALSPTHSDAAHPGPAGPDTQRPTASDLAAPAPAGNGASEPVVATPASHLASLTTVSGAPRADVPTDGAANGAAPGSHAPDTGPAVPVVTGPHADAPVAADPVAAGPPADASTVPADHADTGSAGPSAGDPGLSNVQFRPDPGTADGRPGAGVGVTGRPEEPALPTRVTAEPHESPGPADSSDTVGPAAAEAPFGSSHAAPSQDGAGIDGSGAEAAGQAVPTPRDVQSADLSGARTDLIAEPFPDARHPAPDGQAALGGHQAGKGSEPAQPVDDSASPAPDSQFSVLSGGHTPGGRPDAGSSPEGTADRPPAVPGDGYEPASRAPRPGEPADGDPGDGRGAAPAAIGGHVRDTRAGTGDQPEHNPAYPGHSRELAGTTPGHETPVPVPDRVQVRETVRQDIGNPDMPSGHAAKGYQWARPMVDGKELPAGNGISGREDFRQGLAGTCMIHSAGGEAAEFLAVTDPDTLARWVTDNGDGTVSVRLFETRSTWYGDREWMVSEPTGRVFEVTMPKDVAIQPDGRLAYAKLTRSGAVDAAIVEKAIIAAHHKVAGLTPEELALRSEKNPTGDRFSGGMEADQAEVLTMLTGRPARTFANAELADPAAFAHTLSRIREAGLPVTAGSRPEYTDPLDPQKKVPPPHGLLAGHGYGLKDAVTGPDGTMQLELRNPWGLWHATVPADSKLFEALHPENFVTVGHVTVGHGDGRFEPASQSESQASHRAAQPDAAATHGPSDAAIPSGGRDARDSAAAPAGGHEPANPIDALINPRHDTNDAVAGRGGQAATSGADGGAPNGRIRPPGSRETQLPVLDGTRPQTMVIRPGQEPEPFDPADPMPVARISPDDSVAVVSQWQRQLLQDKPVAVATLPNDMRGIDGEGVLARRWGLDGNQAYDLLDVSEGSRGLANGDAWLTLRKAGTLEDAPVRLPISHIHDELSGTAITTSISAHPDDHAPAPDTFQPDSGHEAGHSPSAVAHPGEKAASAEGFRLNDKADASDISRSRDEGHPNGDHPNGDRANADRLNAGPRTSPHDQHVDAPAQSGGPGAADGKWDHAEVVRIDKTPDLQATSPAGHPLEMGTPLTADHQLITKVIDGDLLPEQFDQLGLGSCALDEDARSVARLWLLAKAGVVKLPDLWTPDRAFRPNGDGTWTLRWPETHLEIGPGGHPDEPYGAAVPTGRLLSFNWDPKNVPVYKDAADPGRPAFVDVRRAGVLWPQGVLESAARFDQAWDEHRAAIHAQEFPDMADLRGYPRLDKGSWRPEQVEFLSQLTGLPAVTVTGRTTDETLALWKALTDEGRPVVTGSKIGVEGNPYDVVSGPHSAHGYGVLKVVDGTQAEAQAEADRLHALIRQATSQPEPTPAGPAPAVTRDPTVPDKAPSAGPDPTIHGNQPAHVPAPAPHDPADPRWPPVDPNERQHWVILDNPWGFHQPKAVPEAHLESLFRFDAATIGTPEQVKSLPHTLAPPSLRDDVVQGRPAVSDPHTGADPAAHHAGPAADSAAVPDGGHPGQALHHQPEFGHDIAAGAGHQPDAGARLPEVRVDPPDRVEIREIRHLTARNPRILPEDADRGVEWGIPRNANGNEIPFREHGRQLSANDVTQGPADCGLMASFQESLRHLQAVDPQAADQMITFNDDGTVTARIYETRLVQREGYRVAVPTGVLYEIRMTRELPLRPDGTAQYADFKHGLTVAMAEKAMAAVDQTGSMWRRAPVDAGYAGINHGTQPPDWAQVLTMWTGKPARTFSVRDTEDPVAFMRTIQKFREADLPVVTGTRQRDEYIRAGNDRFIRVGYLRNGDPIELLAPYYVSPRHAYGVADADGERLLLHNPFGASLQRRGEKVVVPEPDGGPLRHPGFLFAEDIPVDEHLWDTFPSNYWATLDGTGLVHAEQRAFDEALGRAGVQEMPSGELPARPEPAVSEAEARDLFRQLEQHTLTTKDAIGNPERSVPWIGAADRADQMASKLAEWGYEPRKIFAVGPDLKLAPRTIPDWVPRWPAPRARGEVQYNAGVLIRAADEHGIGRDVVLDPLTADRPLTIEEWLGRNGISQNGYRMFDASELDQPGKAAFDEAIGDYFLKAADHGLYDQRALIYAASPDTRYPFAGAEYFGREQFVNPSDVNNYRLSHPVRGRGAEADPALTAIDPDRPGAGLASRTRDAMVSLDRTGAGSTPHPVVRFGLDAGRQVKLDVLPGQEVLIGRSHESPLRLALQGFDTVSRRHATIGADPDGTAWIRDESSANGTFVDGKGIPPGEKVTLPPGGATLRLGDETEIHLSAGIPRADDPGHVAHGEAPAPAEARQSPQADRRPHSELEARQPDPAASVRYSPHDPPQPADENLDRASSQPGYEYRGRRQAGADRVGVPDSRLDPAGIVKVNGDRPNLRVAGKDDIIWGEIPDAFGKSLPVMNDKQTADDFSQGALGNCVNVTIGRQLMRVQNGELGERFLRGLPPDPATGHPWTIKDVVDENDDGSVSLWFHETKLGWDSVAEPTGRMIEMRMERELPTRRGGDPGRTIYTKVKRAGALYPGLVEKGTAALDRSWNPDRIAFNEEQYGDRAYRRGYDRIGNGNNPTRAAELLSQMTGEPAYTMMFRSAEEAAAEWKQLSDAGKPVVIGTLPEFKDDTNPYQLVNSHAYGVVGVVHGTLEEVRALAARLEGGRKLASVNLNSKVVADQSEPYGKIDAIGSSTSGTGEGDSALADDYLIAENPWGRYQPEPIPVRDIDKVFNLRFTATTGVPDYLKHMELDVDHPDLRPEEADKYIYSEPRSASGEMIPFRNGRPDASQVIPGENDAAIMETIRAVTRTHPDLVDAAIEQSPGGGATMQVHEAVIHGNYRKVQATGRVFEFHIKPGLPVDPDTGQAAYANMIAGGAAWPGYMEKGISGIDQKWSPERMRQNTALNPDAPDARGYARVGAKFKLYESAEVLTQLTGHDAVVVTSPTPEQEMADWERLLDEGKPVLVLPKQTSDGPYNLLGNHMYEVAAIEDGHVILTGSQTPDPIPVSEVGKTLTLTYTTVQTPLAGSASRQMDVSHPGP